jgi:hypothetical protein
VVERNYETVPKAMIKEAYIDYAECDCENMEEEYYFQVEEIRSQPILWCDIVRFGKHAQYCAPHQRNYTIDFQSYINTNNKMSADKTILPTSD